MRSLVGFDPLDSVPLSYAEIASSGAASGVLTRTWTQPLDVIKIRFQLQEEPIRRRSIGQSKYVSIRQAVSTITREEGVRGLWKGHVPAQCLSVIYGMTQFASFTALTKASYVVYPAVAAQGEGEGRLEQTVRHAACGGLAGCAATVCSYPMDTVRTRLVAQGEPKLYTSMRSAFAHMVAEEGVRSLFKGLLPTLIEMAPHAGMQFGVYSLCVSFWPNISYLNQHVAAQSLVFGSICGSVAGLTAKAFVHPLDVIKKRLQIQGFTHARRVFGRSSRYAGFLNCLVTMRREEGARGFYKGCLPNLLKATIASALHFAFYECFCRLWKVRKLRNSAGT